MRYTICDIRYTIYDIRYGSTIVRVFAGWHILLDTKYQVCSINSINSINNGIETDGRHNPRGRFTAIIPDKIPQWYPVRITEVFGLVFVFLRIFFKQMTWRHRPNLAISPTLSQAKPTTLRVAKPRNLNNPTKRCGPPEKVPGTG